MNGDESAITSVSFTPDSNYLATGSGGGELRVWDARFGHSVPLAVKAEAHDLGVSSLHFSPGIGKEGEKSKSKICTIIILLILTGNLHFTNSSCYSMALLLIILSTVARSGRNTFRNIMRDNLYYPLQNLVMCCCVFDCKSIDRIFGTIISGV